MAAGDHAVLEQIDVLALALAAVGNIEEEPLEARRVVITGDGLFVDVGKDEGGLLFGVVDGGHGPQRTRVRLRVGVVRLVADLGPSSTYELTWGEQILDQDATLCVG